MRSMRSSRDEAGSTRFVRGNRRDFRNVCSSQGCAAAWRCEASWPMPHDLQRGRDSTKAFPSRRAIIGLACVFGMYGFLTSHLLVD
jgi:hypothetical protein